MMKLEIPIYFIFMLPMCLQIQFKIRFVRDRKVKRLRPYEKNYKHLIYLAKLENIFISKSSKKISCELFGQIYSAIKIVKKLSTFIIDKLRI